MAQNNTPTAPAAPISFKTNVNRHKTQKWLNAAKNNYDGDDWGGYDPYDEYGYEHERPPALPMSASHLPSQRPIPQRPSQEFRRAPPQQPLSRVRTRSFDQGDDGTRSVSAPFPAYSERSGGPASAAGGARASNDMPRSRSRPRDFTNPDQVPPPLGMQPMPRTAPPPAQWFPPRKSSLSTGSDYDSQAQAAEARAIAESVTNPGVSPGAANMEKPLPFIRPSDIYKRIPEEMKRQSEEGSRPSLDSLQRVHSGEQSTLTPVEEARESRLFPDTYTPAQPSSTIAPSQDPPSIHSATSTLPPARETSPTLPLVARVSGFGEDMFSPKAQASEATPTPSGPTLNTSSIDRTPTTFSSLQNTPTTTRPSPAHDPAADILAERQQQTAETHLQHNPSLGFRSAVHQAFDEPALSRDSSQSQSGSGSGVSRSDTTSTAGISPIMSHMPTSAFPPIAEETAASSTSSRPASGSTLTGAHKISRKPSPGHGRSGSADHGMPEGFEPGYRRSLDPPSTGTSPARTPALESIADKRLSTPLSAVVAENEAPDVSDQGAEIPEPNLHAETPASEVAPLTSAPLPTTGRGRSGTDYSMREADLAEQINSSPGKEASLGHAAKNSQDLFLQTHNVQTPTSPLTPTLAGGVGRRADSPAKGRVREIADRYEQSSRRNSAASIGSSQSSWSRFGDDEDKPKLKRAGTSQSNLANEVHPQAGSSTLGGLAPARPEFGREESFKPDLPGAWQSEAPTPAVESPPAVPSILKNERLDLARSETPVDLTPTTKKYQLQGTTSPERSPVDALKDAGNALAESIVSTHGVGHQTRDFASKEPPAPVEQPEFAPRQMTGQLAPPLLRHETDQSSDPPASVASSFAPTPQPARGSGDGGLQPENADYFNTVAPLRVRSREPSPEHHDSSPSAAPAHLSHFSNDSEATERDSDRLHQEIVTSLQDTSEGIDRDQDAIDAPQDQRRVEQGKHALPAAEMAGVGAAALTAGAAAGAAGAGLQSTSSSRPALLDTRFSWENKEPQRHSGSFLAANKVDEEPRSPEIYPEAAYERPRSKQLHVMNAEDGDVSPDTPVNEIPPTPPTPTTDALGVPQPRRPEAAEAEAEITRSLSQRIRGLKSHDGRVSPITKSQEHLLPETTIGPSSPSQSLREMAPSPISNDDASARIPSYYAGATDDVPAAPEKDQGTSPAIQAQPASSPSRPRSGPGAVNIPPFRNILALKTADERIKTYNETRGTFADMDTGLSDWLIAMTHKHPDVSVTAALGKPPPLQTQLSSSGTNTWKRGHRPSPSLAGFKQRFASGSSAQVDHQGRSTSFGSGAQTGLDPSDSANKPSGSGAPRIDMDRVQEQMQQRGKEFMKSASVFGGKTASGAKGLLAKGRSKWGGSVRKTGGGEDPKSPSSAKVGPSSLSSVTTAGLPAKSSNAPLNANTTNSVGTESFKTVANTTTVEPSVLSAPDGTQLTIQSSPEAMHHESAPLSSVINDGRKRQVDGVVGHASAQGSSQAEEDIANATFSPVDGATSPDASAATEPASSRNTQSPSTPLKVTGLAALTAAAALAKPANTDSAKPSESGPASKTATPDPIVDSVASLPARPEHARRCSIPLGSEASSEQSQSLTEFLATDPPAEFDHENTPTKKEFKFPPSSLETQSHPGLSRQASSHSAAAFQRRERSQTPSSASARSSSSRPLSQVFTRLRAKSRSMSRSRKDGSRSRPASLVLAHSNLLEDEKLESRPAKRVISTDSRSTDEAAAAAALVATGPTDLALDDFSDLAIDQSRSGIASPIMAMNTPTSPQRIEAWNSPEATIPPKTPTNPGDQHRNSESGLVGRLGVLPSPAPTAATFSENGERSASTEQYQRRSSAAAWRKGLDDQFGGALASVPSQTPSEDDGRQMEKSEETASPTTHEEQGPDESTPRQADFGAKIATASDELQNDAELTKPSEDAEKQDASPPGTPPPVSRPQQQRKVSDLASLPSQIRRTSQPSTPVKALPMSLPSTAAHSRANSQSLAVILPSNLEASSSRESGLSDAEFVQASPVTIKPAAPALVQHASFRREAAPEDDELYESTPSAPPPTSPWRITHQKPTAPDDEELYESTPVVKRSRVPWRDQIAEQERELERLGEEGQKSNSMAVPATDALKTESKLAEATPNPYQLSASNPADTAQATAGADVDRWEDARSEVSAEEGAHRSSHHTSTEHTASRHSSVSSLGGGARPARANIEPEEPMSSQAVPAGPTTVSVASPLQKLTTCQVKGPPLQPRGPGSGDFSDGFANRQDMQRPGMTERPLSYMPGQRDSAGFVQESISTAQAASSPSTNTPPVDISAIAGPPPSAQPYSQHPAMRLSGHVEPTQYEKMRTSVGSGVLVSPGHSPHNSGDLSGRGSRQSGFFRGDATATAYPTPRNITDQHGLEDLAYGPPTPEDQPQVQDPSKQGGRRSGLWATFSSRRSSGAKIESDHQSRESSIAPLAGDLAGPSTSTAPPANVARPVAVSAMERMESSAKGRNTLTKPQRASSNAIEPEPKKKRFSGLKSLLGRSSTSAGHEKADKESSKKLKKVAPVAEARAPATPPQSRPAPQSRPSDSATIQGAVTGYAEYERARRREGRAFDKQQQAMRQAGPAPPPQPPQSIDDGGSFVPSENVPPAEGWYAPRRDQGRTASLPSQAFPPAQESDQPSMSSQAMPEFRRLHSLGAVPGRARPMAQVPEAFRPVDASFGRPVEPIGPPMPGQFHAPPQQPYVPGYPYQRPMSPSSPMRQREGSYGSEYTNPISGRSEYWPTGQRPFGSGSGASISPIKTRSDSGGYGMSHRDRMGSLSQEVARSPAKEYSDQQTPFAIALPPGHSRQSSWNIPPDARPEGPARAAMDEFYDAQQYQQVGSPPPPRSAMASPPPRPYQQQQQHYALQQQGFSPPPQPEIPMGFPEHFARGQPPPRPPPKVPMIPDEEDTRGAYHSPPYYSEHQLQQMYIHSTSQGASAYQGPRINPLGQQMSQQGWYPRQQAPRPPSQGRYYAQQPQQPRFQYRESYSGRPPQPMQRSFTTGHDQSAYNSPHIPQHRRKPSTGYSGRRDDPTVGEEEEFIMRGASYPGQEWQPQWRE
ncbi:hypothetical protein AC578_5303 [Pseudocercospora eumusae]|uniref:Uncharacterized protein n=1 Tax=Pseudocercospora eumusae TaxID=321146 RepID=A0A139GZW1_9PEZI|nr:hypothetical protein AC578_5303 [Pseudocercospora eumusae]